MGTYGWLENVWQDIRWASALSSTFLRRLPHQVPPSDKLPAISGITRNKAAPHSSRFIDT
jgi:hypothetical protein